MCSKNTVFKFAFDHIAMLGIAGYENGLQFLGAELPGNRNTIAADFGLGANIPINASNCLKIEGRFQYSLTKFLDIDSPDTRVNPLILSLGYLHRI